MIGNVFGAYTGIVALYLLLVMFGIGYNLLIAWLEEKHYLNGYTSLAVVVGVLVTVGMTAVISWQFALITAGAFLASGTPMILGSTWRHIRERERELERLRDQVRNGDQA